MPIPTRSVNTNGATLLKYDIDQLTNGYCNSRSFCSAASSKRALRRPSVTETVCGRAKKYDNDSNEVVRSTVLTFTPRREFSEAGAKFKTALMPADMMWFSTFCAALAGTAITITSID